MIANHHIHQDLLHRRIAILLKIISKWLVEVQALLPIRKEEYQNTSTNIQINQKRI